METKIVKLIEAGSDMEIISGWKGGNRQVVAKGCKPSVMQGEGIL